MVAIGLAGAAPPAAADTVDGAGAIVVGTVEEYSFSWRARLNVEGTFALKGRTYGFFGQIEAYNNCCAPMGSSGSGDWYFSGTLFSPTGLGSASAWSGPMSYTRTQVAPGAPYSLEMRMSGPATAYLPDGGSASFDVSFAVSGTLTGSPLSALCGPYPGCRYDGTYAQTALPSGGAPAQGTGAIVFGTVEEHSYGWRARLPLEGTFVLHGRTYSFFGEIEAYNNCCSPMGSSGSGNWYFSGTLFSPTGLGSASAWSGPMSYTRTQVVPGASSLEMRMSGPATAYVPEGGSVSFDVSFALAGTLTGNPLNSLCGPYPGCRYDGTYVEHDTPSLVAVSATGGATSSGVAVGWGNSSSHGGLVCASATGNCTGGFLANVCVTGDCS